MEPPPGLGDIEAEVFRKAVQARRSPAHRRQHRQAAGAAGEKYLKKSKTCQSPNNLRPNALALAPQLTRIEVAHSGASIVL
jgi:hypothetical protein